MPAVIATKKNYYEVLGLEKDASEDAVRVAYKKLVRWHCPRFHRLHKLTSRYFSKALKWHPDRHQEDKDVAQEKFIEVCTMSFMAGDIELSCGIDPGGVYHGARESQTLAKAQTPNKDQTISSTYCTFNVIDDFSIVLKPDVFVLEGDEGYF